MRSQNSTLLVASLLFVAVLRGESGGDATPGGIWRAASGGDYTPTKGLPEAVADLKQLASTHGFEVTVVLVPMAGTLLVPDAQGRLMRSASEPSEALRTIAAAGRWFAEVGLDVIPLHDAVHAAVFAEPSAELFTSNPWHYTPLGLELVARHLLEADPVLADPVRRKGVLLMGDCHAFTAAREFERIGPEGVTLLFRNGAANFMVLDLSRMSPEEMDAIRHVYWFLQDRYLLPAGQANGENPPPFQRARPPAVAGSAGSDARVWESVVIARSTTVQVGFERDASYRYALVAHEFRPADGRGKPFIGLAYVLRDRVSDESVRRWSHGVGLRVLVEPWDAACKRDRRLETEQIIDDVADTSLDWFYIHEWLRFETAAVASPESSADPPGGPPVADP